ncbi:MAG: hypothetical protein E6K10_00605 [Methanobacteriota archaeon]|nr:MAG: hypothetical protein E6K10_00605 [Euryarchaeota archaeon]
MPADPHLHEFTMLQRAVRANAAKGMFDESRRLLLKLFEIAPEDANYSRTKWRFAAELVKAAVVQQKRAVAADIAALAELKIDAAHLTSAEVELMARAKGDVTTL